MSSCQVLRIGMLLFCLIVSSPAGGDETTQLRLPSPPNGSVRFATYNVSLHRKSAGELVRDLERDDKQARQLATILQWVRPDVLLINEIDFDSDNKSLSLFRDRYLHVGQHGLEPLSYPFAFTAPVNTGVASGLDLNGNGKSSDPEDNWGFGTYPGQYGMAIYSRYPIDTQNVRTFQKLKWSQMPDALKPWDPERDAPYWPETIWQTLRLSSKSHWDVPIQIEDHVVHALVAHPTPPVFDGKEDRNGRRNHDEIRFLYDYVHAATDHDYIRDDAGKEGRLEPHASFVIMGDLNADPHDGSGRSEAIRMLLRSPRLAQGFVPRSQGGIEASREQGQANVDHQGDASQDTADFNDRSSGNLRCDFVLPSNDLAILNGGVFWPSPTQVKAIDTKLMDASDHRPVWLDIQLPN